MSGIEITLVFCVFLVWAFLFCARLSINEMEYHELSECRGRSTYETKEFFRRSSSRRFYIRAAMKEHKQVNLDALMISKVDAMHRHAFWFCFSFLITMRAFA